MPYIEASTVEALLKQTLTWRTKAHKAYLLAVQISDAYVAKWESGEYTSTVSRTDAQARASEDSRWQVAVSNNQMYDRFAQRDAAVLSAIANLVNANLLTVRD